MKVRCALCNKEEGIVPIPIDAGEVSTVIYLCPDCTCIIKASEEGIIPHTNIGYSS